MYQLSRKDLGLGSKNYPNPVQIQIYTFFLGKESLLCDWANQTNLSVLSLAVKRGSQPDSL